jgi:hypothetical protein
MNLRQAYRDQGPRGILVQAVVGILAGILVGGISTLLTRENGIRKFWIPIVGVPLSLTILKLLLLLGDPEHKKDGPNDPTRIV